MSPIGWEATDMVHRNRMLGLAREAAAASTVDLLNRELRDVANKLRELQRAYVDSADAVDAVNAENQRLRTELTIATCAALAANEFYRAEYMGEKTYLTPTETRERFGAAMVAYREATGADT